MKTDIQIAQEATMLPIKEVTAKMVNIKQKFQMNIGIK